MSLASPEEYAEVKYLSAGALQPALHLELISKYCINTYTKLEIRLDKYYNLGGERETRTM